MNIDASVRKHLHSVLNQLKIDYEKMQSFEKVKFEELDLSPETMVSFNAIESNGSGLSLFSIVYNNDESGIIIINQERNYQVQTLDSLNQILTNIITSRSQFLIDSQPIVS